VKFLVNGPGRHFKTSTIPKTSFYEIHRNALLLLVVVVVVLHLKSNVTACLSVPMERLS
jgi:hypothetical protein